MRDICKEQKGNIENNDFNGLYDFPEGRWKACEAILDKLQGDKKPKAAGKCRVCGCTDDHACPGGCYWVEPDLCSVCAEKLKENRGVGTVKNKWYYSLRRLYKLFQAGNAIEFKRYGRKAEKFHKMCAAEETQSIIFMDGICPECGQACSNSGHGPLRCQCGWVGKGLLDKAQKDIEKLFARDPGKEQSNG